MELQTNYFIMEFAMTQTAVEKNIHPITKLPCTRIIISHGDKGGVGKSMVASAIADYLNTKSVKVAIIDADTQNPDVDRMFGKWLPCAKTNLRSTEGWMDVMNFIAEHAGHTIVINTPGGIGEHMVDDMRQLSAFLDDIETTSEMELWWTINRHVDSVNLLERAYDSYGKYFKRLRVVRNLSHSMGDPKAFIFWDESTLKPKIEKHGGISINFPALHDRVTAKLFNPNKLMPFSAALDAALGETIGLSPSERFKLKDWFREVGVCFNHALNTDNN